MEFGVTSKGEDMNLDKIETQEEKEAFEGMAKSSEAPNSSEWKNGDECLIRGDKLIYIGESIEADIHCVQEFGTCIYRNAHISVIEKPETPEQKAERESNEKLLCEIMRHDILHDAITHLGDFANAVQVRIAVCEDEEGKVYWARQLERINGIQSFVNKTNYRKQND